MENLIFLVDIPGFEGYYGITEEGEIYSIKSERFLKPNVDSMGYFRVTLTKDGVKTGKKVHRIIAEILIPNPNNHPLVDHIDRDKRNNSISNLRWGSYAQNAANRPSKPNSSSKYKGVYFRKDTNKWEARIQMDWDAKYLGCFKTEIEAAIAYNKGIDRYCHSRSEFYYRNEV